MENLMTKSVISHRLLQLVVTVLACLMPQCVYGVFMVDGLYYVFNDNQTSVLVTSENSAGPRYSNLTGDLVIPPAITYEGTTYPVSGINGYAFMMCNDITSVTIPSSVTYIGSYAFNSCNGLKAVVLPDSLSYVDVFAFAQCVSLETVVLPSKIRTLVSGMFFGCTALKEVSFPPTLESIGSQMFSGCVNLTEVRLPEKLKFIGSYAFYDCSGITDLDLPLTLTGIDDYAFGNCTGLTNITLPATLVGMGYDVFQGCGALKEIKSLALTPPNAHEDEEGYEGQFHVVYPGTFNSVDKENCVLRVFESAMADYKRAKGWRQFTNVETLNESEYLPGDVNGDGVVDIADVNGVVNDMLGKADVVIGLNEVKFGLAMVQGGTFEMGAEIPQEELEWGFYDSVPSPKHQVTLDSYFISTTEVTRQLWHAVMGGTEPEYDMMNRPIYDINWNAAQTFIERLNQLTGLQFRLPTEAEWEFAARGGNKSQGYLYSGSNDPNEVGWCSYNPWGPEESKKPRPVGKKSPNELGIYDMSGNVWEWCQDWFADYTDEPQVNPTGPETGTRRVIRGGSCYNDHSETHCSVYNRAAVEPTKTVYGSFDQPIGIRLAMDYTPELYNRACDVTGDGRVDIADVNAVINIMLGRADYDVPTGNPGHDTDPGR